MHTSTGRVKRRKTAPNLARRGQLLAAAAVDQTRTLLEVAVAAKELDVQGSTRTAPRPGDDVVEVEVLRRAAVSTRAAVALPDEQPGVEADRFGVGRRNREARFRGRRRGRRPEADWPPQVAEGRAHSVTPASVAKLSTAVRRLRSIMTFCLLFARSRTSSAGAFCSFSVARFNES